MTARPIPIELWGKDHWSTLLYAQSCAVDGISLDIRRMRCNNIRHPLMAHLSNSEDEYPTMLYGSAVEHEHDDWDCLWDAKSLGLIKLTGIPQGVMDVAVGARGNLSARLSVPLKQSLHGFIWVGKPTVKFTEKGFAIMAALTKHKASGGNFSTFQWKETVDKLA